MDITYSKFDSTDDIQRKLANARNLLNVQVAQKDRDRMPLYEAYIEFSIGVFERDLSSRA